MQPRRLALLIALFALGVIAGLAQTVSSSILGIVVDPAGSVVPGAEIKITNLGTAAVQNTVSDSAGFFRVTNILAGAYTVTVQAKGFKLLAVNNIDLGTSEAHDLGKLALAL